MSKEVNENFDPAMRASEFFEPIKKGWGNVWHALKTSASDIISSLKYAFNVTFTLDREAVEKAKRKRNNELNKLSSEYSHLWKNIVNSNPDVSTIAMLAAPLPYFLAYITLNKGTKAIEFQGFLKNTGVPSDWLGIDNAPENSEDREYVRSMMLRRTTSGIQATAIEEELRDIAAKLQIAFGSVQAEGLATLNDKLLREDEKKETPGLTAQEINKNYSDLKRASKQFTNDKKRQYQDIENDLTALDNYEKALANSIQKSTSIEQISKLIESFSNEIKNLTYVSIRVEFEPGSFIKSIDKNFQELVSQKKVQKENEKDAKLEIAKALAARVISGQYSQKKQEMLKELIGIWMDQIPQNVFMIMREKKPDDEYVKTISKGISLLTGRKIEAKNKEDKS